MNKISRRKFFQLSAAFGATAAWAHPDGKITASNWRERRDLFPQGVASADPDEQSVILWTRKLPGTSGSSETLRVEVAADESFKKVIVSEHVRISSDSDWTCRVLVGGLRPLQVYWYRFTDSEGNGSRIGRTRTAPAANDASLVRFAFMSCQNVCQGAQNAYRRMIYDDQRLPENEQLEFVLHLGDFIYELVWYPEDRPQGMYDRRLRDLVRYEHGEKIRDFHIPTTLNDYRTAYKIYLQDPDLQDARARWPFVNMWDNHEFSWLGRQSLQKFGDMVRPAQTRKVAANQAFFEFQPGRLIKPSGPSLETFDAPLVADAPVVEFDEHGLGLEPNNLKAIESLTGYRALRWGQNVELIVTDQHSYRSADPTDTHEARQFTSDDFPEMVPEEMMKIVDGGKAYAGGNPPETIRYGDTEIPNYARKELPQTILGSRQKAWFLSRLQSSKATWKIWGNTVATLDMRADPQNLPAGMTKPWPGKSYAGFAGGDFSTAYAERGEIYDFVREHGITGFATVAGDRHSFWAGLAAKSLPPDEFRPVGIAFVTGSISAPGMVEAIEHTLPKEHPLRALYLGQAPSDSKPQPTVNMMLRHGVHSCLEYAASGDIEKARAVSNPDLSPHATFVDMGGHGYGIVHASSKSFEVEFVCIPRHLERSGKPDGGPVLYRAKHSANLWESHELPKLKTWVAEGDARFNV